MGISRSFPVMTIPGVCSNPGMTGGPATRPVLLVL